LRGPHHGSHPRGKTTKRLKRPRDPIALAKLIGDIATSQVDIATSQVREEAEDKRNPLAVTRRKAGGKKGGRLRAFRLTPKQRSEIARIAAQTRWKKSG